MIKISYAVNENLFAESLHLLFQNIRIARMMKDVCQVTELSIMMTTLLQRLELSAKAEKIYDFLRNFICEMN
jgi:hypothetical protein